MKIRKTEDISDDLLDARVWELSDRVTIRTYWDGSEAAPSREFSVGLLHSDDLLYVYFDAFQAEDLIVSATHDISAKTVLIAGK